MIVTPGTLNHFWTHPTLELHFVVTRFILHRSHVIELGSNFFLSAPFFRHCLCGHPWYGAGGDGNRMFEPAGEVWWSAVVSFLPVFAPPSPEKPAETF
jgi:hypothetical protein